MRTVMLLWLVINVALGQTTTQVDVCVYGGTSAGVIAAYTAKMYGKKVLLIEPGKHLGGLSSGGLGYTDIGNKYAVTGLARDFYRKVGQRYGKFEQWIFEPHVAEAIFNEYISRAQVQMLLEHRITAATKKDGAITEIKLEPVAGGGQQVVQAKVFIDCSYEGDLMAKAGITYTVGREANSKYDETYNGVQLLDKHQFPDGIDPYRIKGRPESGLISGISATQLQPRGSGDSKVQAYNFRICLTDNPANRITIEQPADYDSSRYELLARLFEKEPQRPFNLILKPDLMPNRKTDINNNGPISTDMIGMNYNYPDAGYDERIRIVREHESYVKGLLFYIGHSPRVPAPIRNEMLKWGYPKDEYHDNGNWSPQLYVRESRRMVGEYVMSQANCEGRAKAEDAAGMAAYTMDSHNVQRLVVNGMVKNEGDVQIGGFPPYPISYRALVPKVSECSNLLVPVCLSATHIAYGSIRMEPVFMALAQSSAIAAVMAADRKIPVQQVNVKLLQQRLKIDPLADGSTPEILVDNDDKNSVVVEGTWTTMSRAPGAYGPTLFADTVLNQKPRAIRFIPSIAKAGDYQVYVYCPRTSKGTTKLTVAVFDGKQSREVTISPNDVKVEGQTSGEWINVGKHKLPAGRSAYAAVTNKGSDGIVVADAVLFVPASN